MLLYLPLVDLGRSCDCFCFGASLGFALVGVALVGFALALSFVGDLAADGFFFAVGI